MSEKFRCQEVGSKPECTSCDHQEVELPFNLPQGASLPCKVESRQIIREGEEVLRKLAQLRRETRLPNKPDIIVYTGTERFENGY